MEGQKWGSRDQSCGQLPEPSKNTPGIPGQRRGSSLALPTVVLWLCEHHVSQ